MNPRVRIAVAALSISGAGLVGIAVHEGYTDRAIIPVPGDRPTVGFGSTTRADGSPVQLGDTVTPPMALGRMLVDIKKFEGAVKKCVTVPLLQDEYDAFTSLAYNIGPGLFCSSSIVRRANAGDFQGACEAIRLYVCGPATQETRAKPGERCYDERRPLRVIPGLVNRREAERKQCLGEEPV